MTKPLTRIEWMQKQLSLEGDIALTQEEILAILDNPGNGAIDEFILDLDKEWGED